MDSNLIVRALIVLISYTTQAMSGFGSTILALTLGLHLYPINVLLPVLVPLDMIVYLYPDRLILDWGKIFFAGLSICIG